MHVYIYICIYGKHMLTEQEASNMEMDGHQKFGLRDELHNSETEDGVLRLPYILGTVRMLLRHTTRMFLAQRMYIPSRVHVSVIIISLKFPRPNKESTPAFGFILAR